MFHRHPSRAGSAGIGSFPGQHPAQTDGSTTLKPRSGGSGKTTGASADSCSSASAETRRCSISGQTCIAGVKTPGAKTACAKTSRSGKSIK